MEKRETKPKSCECAQEFCLTVGVQSEKLCPILCHTWLKIGAAEVVHGSTLRFHSYVRIPFHHGARNVPGERHDG
jgi:hypothetical protein